MNGFLLFLIFYVCVGFCGAQELMTKIEDSDAVQLLNLPAVVTITDDNKIVGTVSNIYLTNGNLTNVSLKLQNGSEQKFKASEIQALEVRCIKPTMFSLLDSTGNVIKKIINTQFVFEHPFKTEKKVKPEMRQLLNPAFDDKIKIFPDPSANETRSISIKGTPLPGGQATAYIFIKKNKTYYVKQSTYKESFKQLFSDCESMRKLLSSDLFFEELASHVILYDHYCSAGK
jgi:hypothetical protein